LIRNFHHLGFMKNLIHGVAAASIKSMLARCRRMVKGQYTAGAWWRSSGRSLRAAHG
jgi:hypothetical protein